VFFPLPSGERVRVRVKFLKKKPPSLSHPAKSAIWQGTRALPPSEGREKKEETLSCVSAIPELFFPLPRRERARVRVAFPQKYFFSKTPSLCPSRQGRGKEKKKPSFVPPFLNTAITPVSVIPECPYQESK